MPLQKPSLLPYPSYGFQPLLPQVRDLFFLLQDLFFLLKDLCEIVGDLWSILHAACGWADETELSRWEMRWSVWWRLFLRACIYVFYFLKKVFTHSRNARRLLIFNSFECEGFDFKVFTGAAKHSHGRWTLVKGGKRKPSHRKTTRKSADQR